MAIKLCPEQCHPPSIYRPYRRAKWNYMAPIHLGQSCLQVHGGTMVTLRYAANHPNDGASYTVLCPLPAVSRCVVRGNHSGGLAFGGGLFQSISGGPAIAQRRGDLDGGTLATAVALQAAEGSPERLRIYWGGSPEVLPQHCRSKFKVINKRFHQVFPSHVAFSNQKLKHPIH
jgi:hypothetical protein